jgi:hypothetical protein
MNGVHPNKDAVGAAADVIPDALWQLLLGCWNLNDAARPCIADILEILETMVL